MKTVCKKLFCLLLVAVLMLSAVPFQAFADPCPEGEHTFDPNTGTCTKEGCGQVCTHPEASLGAVQKASDAEHMKVCGVCGAWTNYEAHGEWVQDHDDTYHFNKCGACGYVNESSKVEHTFGAFTVTTEPDCTNDGEKTATCTSCPQTKTESIPADPSAHNWVNDNCSVCGTPKNTSSDTVTLTFHYMNGTSDTSTSTIKANTAIGTVPAKPATYVGEDKEIIEFKYWAIGSTSGTKLEAGSKFTADTDIYGFWSVPTFKLTVKYIKNGKLNSAQNIAASPYDVKKNTSVLDFVKTTVLSDLPAIKGYTWEKDKYWYDYSGKQPMLGQPDKMDQAYTVYVNYNANKYNLFFNVGSGATVSPEKMEVTFDQAIGTMPVPVWSGHVFQNWVDEDGKVYKKDDIFKDDHDVTLIPVWEDEALVHLRIYMNGNTSAPDRILNLDKYIDNQNVTRETVEKILCEKYEAKPGKTMTFDGLFDDNTCTWADYVKNTSKKGTPTIQIDVNKKPNNIYVMVNNAQYKNASSSGSSSGSSSNNSNGNPKTGDNVMIEAAVAVMALTAVAFVTMEQLRKRNKI